jgi:hypothetical protein
MPSPSKTEEYLDFELSIWAEQADPATGEALKCCAKVRSPHGSSETVSVDLFDSIEEAKNMRGRAQGVLTRGAADVRGTAEEKPLREFGQRVFERVFRQTDVAELYAKNRGALEDNRDHAGVRITLRIDSPQLAALPWEYLHGGSDFLGLYFESPIIRCPEAQAPALALEVEGPLNILGMIANPRGKWAEIKADRERHNIETALEEGHKAGRINLRWVPGETPDQLLDQMSKGGPWHVFHFIGHGGIWQPEPGAGAPGLPEGFIVFSDGQGGAIEASARELVRWLDSYKRTLRVVVLNCCESARGASPAMALIRYGVPAVVGMQFPISDDAAIQFARAFYDQLGDNRSLEYAVTFARKKMAQKSPEWGVPVLYSRARSGRLFTVSPSSAASTPAPGPLPSAPGTNTDARARLRALFDERPSGSVGAVR